WDDGMKSVDVVGPAFLAQGVVGIVLAVLVVAWRHWLPVLGAVAFGAASLVALALATLPAGFFGVHERWTNSSVLVAAMSEAVAVVLGLLALRPRPAPGPGQRARPRRRRAPGSRAHRPPDGGRS